MISKLVNSIGSRAASGWDATLGKLGGSRREKWRIGVEPYPQMRFILLGDTGQEDAAIYGRVARDFPDRILCSYIRDTGHVNRAMIVEAEGNAQLGGSELLVMKDSDSIRAHSLKKGWLER